MNDVLKDELYHKWTDAMKANYNREYYQKHKDLWKTKYADFTGSVKRAAANAKETVKGETPQSLWKSGARDIRKNLPELKKGISSNAKTLAERAKRKAPEVIDEAKWQADRLARKTGADKAKALLDDGAKDIKPKAYKTARKTAKKVHDAKVDIEWAINNNDVAGNAKRKAKAFVSNLKSGAQGFKSAAKSATSKAGKSFLDNWKSGAQSIRDSKIPGIENVSRKRGKGNPIEKQTSAVTVGDVMESMKGSKRTLSGQPKGFVENWKQGAGDIKNAITKKKRKK